MPTDNSALKNSSPHFTDFHSVPSNSERSGASPIGHTANTTVPTNDDFANFQVSSGSGKSSTSDKLSSLKAMLSDRSLFSTQPTIAKDFEGISGDSGTKDDEWGQLSTSEDTSQSQSSSESTNKFDSFIPSSDVDATSSSSDLFSSSHTTGDKDDDDWANFESGPTNAGHMDWSPPPKNSPSVNAKHSFNSTSVEPSSPKQDSTTMKVDQKKAYSFFGRNLDISRAGMAGTGMSALDVEPPDFPPEIPDDEDDDGFDKFGTFQSNSNMFNNTSSTATGLSSLVTPYGGLEDFGEFSKVTNSNNGQNPTTAEGKKDTVSQPPTAALPSIDFNNWQKMAKKDDTVSIKSLELRTQLTPKDGSPSGADSQSVSSLEFATSDSRKSTTPQDARSVASLEFKTAGLETPQEESKPLPSNDRITDVFSSSCGSIVLSNDSSINGMKNTTHSGEWQMCAV